MMKPQTDGIIHMWVNLTEIVDKDKATTKRGIPCFQQMKVRITHYLCK